MTRFLNRRAAVPAALIALLAAAAPAASAASQGSTAIVSAQWTCDTDGIVITSTKDLSNIVLVVDGVNVRVYEDSWAGGSIVLDPSATPGVISGVYIKSGSNASAKGGLGEYVALSAPDCTVPDPDPTITDPTITVDEPVPTGWDPT